MVVDYIHGKMKLILNSFNYTTNDTKLSELESPSVSNLYNKGEMIYFIGHLATSDDASVNYNLQIGELLYKDTV